MTDRTAINQEEQHRVMLTRREWNELQNILMALETLNWLDDRGDLDPAPLLSLGRGVELRFRRLVQGIRRRVDPEAVDDFD